MAQITAIWNDVIETSTATFTTQPKAIASLTDQLAGGQPYMVAERMGQVVGFATYSQFRGGPGYARTMELSIHLAPEARGKGTGTALMRALIDRARQEGVETLWAGISSDNPRSIPFHTRLGFAEVAVLERVGTKWGRWFDLHLLRLWLADPALRR